LDWRWCLGRVLGLLSPLNKMRRLAWPYR
jgi:hypothetical protein